MSSPRTKKTNIAKLNENTMRKISNGLSEKTLRSMAMTSKTFANIVKKNRELQQRYYSAIHRKMSDWTRRNLAMIGIRYEYISRIHMIMLDTKRPIQSLTLVELRFIRNHVIYSLKTLISVIDKLKKDVNTNIIKDVIYDGVYLLDEIYNRNKPKWDKEKYEGLVPRKNNPTYWLKNNKSNQQSQSKNTRSFASNYNSNYPSSNYNSNNSSSSYNSNYNNNNSKPAWLQQDWTPLYWILSTRKTNSNYTKLDMVTYILHNKLGVPHYYLNDLKKHTFLQHIVKGNDYGKNINNERATIDIKQHELTAKHFELVKILDEKISHREIYS